MDTTETLLASQTDEQIIAQWQMIEQMSKMLVSFDQTEALIETRSHLINELDARGLLEQLTGCSACGCPSTITYRHIDNGTDCGYVAA